MEITEVRIKLMEEPSERLQAFCSITFDNSFVVRDLKIIEGNKGPFVAMPSRKLTDRCQRCNCKNHLRAQYCSQCGLRLGDDRAIKDPDGRAKLHADIAHPINTSAREMIQQRVLDAFAQERHESQLPGYVSSYDDDYDDPDDSFLALGDPSDVAEVRGNRAPENGKVISRVERGDNAAQGPHRRPAEKTDSGDRAASEPDTTFGAGIL